MNYLSDQVVPNFFKIGYMFKYLIDQNIETISDYRKTYNETLRKEDIPITNQQVIILMYLLLHKDATVKSIAENMSKEPPNIASQIKILQRIGFVNKNPDKNDKRRVNINLTKKGKDFVKFKPDSITEKIAKRISVRMNKDPDKIEELNQAFSTIMDFIIHVHQDYDEEMPDVFKFYNEWIA